MERKAPDERRERQRLAAEGGAKALAEYAAHDIAVRNNMAMLRWLRESKTEIEKPHKKGTGVGRS